MTETMIADRDSVMLPLPSGLQTASTDSRKVEARMMRKGLKKYCIKFTVVDCNVFLKF